MSSKRTSLGAALDAAIRDTTEEWFRQHLGQRSREEATSNDWKALTATQELKPGGFLTITVHILTRRSDDVLTDIYRLRRIEGQGYVREASSNGKS
jgi:hypothetical protein